MPHTYGRKHDVGLQIRPHTLFLMLTILAHNPGLPLQVEIPTAGSLLRLWDLQLWEHTRCPHGWKTAPDVIPQPEWFLEEPCAWMITPTVVFQSQGCMNHPLSWESYQLSVLPHGSGRQHQLGAPILRGTRHLM